MLILVFLLSFFVVLFIAMKRKKQFLGASETGSAITSRLTGVSCR
jgi:hypothetical protein